MSTTSPKEIPKYYNYEPSFAAAIAVACLFVLIGCAHTFLLVRRQTWFFIPFVVGVWLEALGYLSRGWSSKQTPNWQLPPFLIATLFILIAPAVLAASIYMILGRLIATVAPSISPIPLRWLTKIFVTGDVLSFFVQAIGGSLLSQKTKKKMDLGKNLVVVGLCLQIVFFGVFCIVSIVSHRRMNQIVTPYGWKKHMIVLYSASVLILIRSVFRVIEYVMGRDGVLLSNELYLYVFDSALMVVCVGMYVWFYPAQIREWQDGKKRPEDSRRMMELESVDAEQRTPEQHPRR